MRMHNPPHPGETLKEDVLPGLHMSVTEAADHLGVSRVQFSRLLNGKAGISPAMAIRLSQWLGTSPEVWLNQQVYYDLWQVEQSETIEVRRAVQAECGS